MILGLEVGMLVYGLYALFTGKFQLSKANIVVGNRARIAAFILVLPLPLAFAAGFAIGSSGSFTSDNTLSLAGIELGIVIACLVLALGIAYTAPETEKLKNS